MRARLTIAMAALVVGTAACGGGAQSGSGPVSLRMTVWTANETHLSLFKQLAEEYRASHPDVAAITFDPLPLDAYTTTLTTQIAGNKAPDLAWILENAAPDFVTSGALVPLDDALRKADGYRYDELVPAATKLWTAGDKLYAYPFSTSPFGIFVNTDLVRQAGQRPPAELIAAGQWNWDTATKVAASINAKTGKTGLVVRDFDYKSWDNLSTVWNGWGAQPWTPDGRKCGFDQPEMVAAMTFLHRSTFVDKAFLGPGSSADFFAGAAGMTITQISRASLLKDAKFGWDLVPLPTGPKGRYAVIGQAGIGVLKKGANPAAAADFLAFFTNPANSAKLAQFFPPPRQSLLTAETLGKANPLLTPAQLQSVVIDGISTGVVKPSHTGSAELNQAVRAGLDPLWQSGSNIREVLGTVCGTIQPLLDKK